MVRIVGRGGVVVPRKLAVLTEKLARVRNMLTGVTPSVGVIRVTGTELTTSFLRGFGFGGRLGDAKEDLLGSIQGVVSVPSVAASLVSRFVGNRAGIGLSLHISGSLTFLLEHLMEGVIVNL